MRIAACFLFLLVTLRPLAGQDVFRFAPSDGITFVRTRTSTGRLEREGMVRTETTVFRARMVFREIPSGFRLTMTPLSFSYSVNGTPAESPVWDLIRGHDLVLKFNVVGKLVDVHGYDDIDKELTKGRVYSPHETSLHLDRFPLGEWEKEAWDTRILLWQNQPSKVGTRIAFDSDEAGFTGQPVPSHTSMKVSGMKPCGAARCVTTVYTMVPDLTRARMSVNEQMNNDFIDATASEKLEQTIEPETMLPHWERLTWTSSFSAQMDDGTLSSGTSLVSVSDFAYDVKKGSNPAAPAPK